MVMAQTPTPSTAIPVEIVETESGYALYRGGEPYVVKGAGMVVDDLDRFIAHGGNSIRMWSTRSDEVDLEALLDRAHEMGVSVALTLPMAAERGGFDYNDADAVAHQLAWMQEDVIRFKDHPAVLVWIIGNELNHSYQNVRVWDAVNEVALMIKRLDPHHPITTAIAGFYENVVSEVQARAPALDFLSFQVYGTLFGLPEAMRKAQFDAPFMVTEWGTIGWWEMETTHWGAPVELTSSEKAAVFRRGHDEILASFKGGVDGGRPSQLIGDYAFFWGQKQERTPTWFGVVTAEGELTEAADVLEMNWTGQWPSHRSPRLKDFRLDGQTSRQSVLLLKDQAYEAVVELVDDTHTNLDDLNYHWEVKPESQATQVGGDREDLIDTLAEAVVTTDGPRASIRLNQRGAYRLFVRITDPNAGPGGRAAHANIPFFVEDGFVQTPDDRVDGEIMAVAYSGFRAGQHPDRGEGAINPSREEILEDLHLLADNGFTLIRLYDAGANSEMVLELIREHDMDIHVMLGLWLNAELSNHEGCPWLTEPIPETVLAANRLANQAEIQRGIALAKAYEDVVVSINVGNEALVSWTDHLVPVSSVIDYVRQVKVAVNQSVTVAENYEWWIQDGQALAEEVDFLGVHSYPVWEGRAIDAGLSYTIENLMRVKAAHPDRPMAVLEAGWATTASEFGDRASEAAQARYFDELEQWARRANVTVFFFEAFDEPWKGDPNDPLGAEKHWGIFFEDRTPKALLKP
jgi:exo-beta-1,3-glucanase (GH17 family)